MYTLTYILATDPVLMCNKACPLIKHLQHFNDNLDSISAGGNYLCLAVSARQDTPTPYITYSWIRCQSFWSAMHPYKNLDTTVLPGC